MKRTVVAVCVVGLALPFVALAQPKPDFSGIWTMDLERSISSTYPEFGGAVTLVIRQTDTELTIETKRGARSATVTYKPGTPSTTPAGGVDPPGPGAPPSRWYWDGPKLVTETVRLASDAPEGTFRTKEVRSLNSTGTEMTVETTLVVEHGYTLKGTKNHETGKDIYKKSSSD